MRRCYRAAALVLGTILTTGLASFNSCSIGTLTAYAAEDTLAEELATAFQQEVQAGAENVETEIPAEEAAVQPAQEEPMAEEVVPEEPVPEEPAPEEVPTEAVAANFNLDEQEYQVLLRIVEAEAGGEDTVGKMLVANVIMNRVTSGIFPATVTGMRRTVCPYRGWKNRPGECITGYDRGREPGTWRRGCVSGRTFLPFYAEQKQLV